MQRGPQSTQRTGIEKVLAYLVAGYISNDASEFRDFIGPCTLVAKSVEHKQAQCIQWIDALYLKHVANCSEVAHGV